MTLESYFEKFPVSDHKLTFLGVREGVIHITLMPMDLGEGETAFVLPNIVAIDCKLFNAGICKGSK